MRLELNILETIVLGLKFVM